MRASTMSSTIGCGSRWQKIKTGSPAENSYSGPVSQQERAHDKSDDGYIEISRAEARVLNSRQCYQSLPRVDITLPRR